MERRSLTFDSLDEVAQDAEALLANGYERLGNWNLSQVCGHLDQWMSFPMDGFPKPRFPMNVILWVMKVTIAKKALQQVLENGFTPGRPTMPQTVPPAEATDDQAAVAALKHTIARFNEYDGPIHPSPLFGPLDRTTALKVQLRHCEHHLSFLATKKESD